MISFVYFDVGGVVIKDFTGTNKWTELQHDIGINEINKSLFDDLWSRYSNEICTNRDVDSLIPILNKECNLNLPNSYSLLDDFVRRFDKNLTIWPIISHIRKFCRIGLLTNMYPRMFERIIKNNLFLYNKWDIVIDSSVVKYQKPNPAIYKIAERSAALNSKEILFVENSIENVEVAKQLGWNTLLYDTSNPDVSNTILKAMFK